MIGIYKARLKVRSLLRLLTTTQTEDQMKGRLFLNVIVAESTTILELLSGKDQSLLVWWDTLLVLNLALDVVDRVGRLDFERDGFTSEGFDKDLHTTTESENQVESGFFLNVCDVSVAFPPEETYNSL